MGFHLLHAPFSGVWVMNYRKRQKPDKGDDVGRCGTPPDAGSELEPLRTGIGAELQKLHSDLLREELPDRIADLLRRLDQQRDADSA